MRHSDRPAPDTWASYSRAARVAAGLSQGVLAERVGVSRQTINRWETGKFRPEHPKMVERFVYIVGVDLNEALAAAGLRPGVVPSERPASQQLPQDPVLAEVQRLLDDPEVSDEAKAGYRAMLKLMVNNQPDPDPDRYRYQPGREAS